MVLIKTVSLEIRFKKGRLGGEITWNFAWNWPQLLRKGDIVDGSEIRLTGWDGKYPIIYDGF